MAKVISDDNPAHGYDADEYEYTRQLVAIQS